eukprot:Awhi_evm1s15710
MSLIPTNKNVDNNRQGKEADHEVSFSTTLDSLTHEEDLKEHYEEPKNYRSLQKEVKPLNTALSQPWKSFTFDRLLEKKDAKPFTLGSFRTFCASQNASNKLAFIEKILKLKKEEKETGLVLKEKVVAISNKYIIADHYKKDNVNTNNTNSILDISDDLRERCRVAFAIQILNGGEEKGTKLHLQRSPSMLENHVLVVTSIFGEIYDKIYDDMKKDEFRRFVDISLARQVVGIAKFDALWFLPQKTQFKGNGIASLKTDNKLSFKSFFSFPDIVVEAESQCLNLLIFILTVIFILLDFLAFHTCVPWFYLFLVYGFLVRFLCGPKLSPLSFISLFLVTPFMLRRARMGVLRPELIPGFPKHFAQFAGFLNSALAFGFRLADFYTVADLENTGIADRPYLIISMALWGVFLTILMIDCLFGKCAGCVVYGALAWVGIFPTPCLKCQIDVGTASNFTSRASSDNETSYGVSTNKSSLDMNELNQDKKKHGKYIKKSKDESEMVDMDSDYDAYMHDVDLNGLAIVVSCDHDLPAQKKDNLSKEEKDNLDNFQVV